MFDYTLLTFDTQPDFGYSLTQFTHQLPDDAVCFYLTQSSTFDLF